MPKYVLRIFFVSLIIGFAFRADGLAQLQYEIIAVKGKVGIIRTPLDRPLQVGETFTVVRYRGSRRIEVARVKVALVAKKFTGIKIIEPLQDTQLRKGDLLEVDALSLEERLQELERQEADPTGELLASKTPVSSSNNNEHPTETAAVPSQQATSDWSEHPAVKKTTTGGPTYPAGPLHIVRQNRPFIGPVVAAFVPFNALAEEMVLSGQAGIQVTTLLHRQTHLQFGLQYAPMRLSNGFQTRLQQLGIAQTSYLLLITASLQQYFAGRFFWNVGSGIYRFTHVQTIGGEQLQVSKNYLGVHAGAGLHVFSSQSSRLQIGFNGHMYFPENSYRVFFSVLTSWSYSL